MKKHIIEGVLFVLITLIYVFIIVTASSFVIGYLPVYILYFIIIVGTMQSLYYPKEFYDETKKNLSWNMTQNSYVYFHFLMGAVISTSPYVFAISWGVNISGYLQANYDFFKGGALLTISYVLIVNTMMWVGIYLVRIEQK